MWTGRAVLWLLAMGLSSSAWAQEIVAHRLAVALQPASGELVVHDRITLPPHAKARFTLDAGLVPQVADHELRRVKGRAADGLRTYQVELPEGVRSFELSYRGRLGGASEAAFSADNVVLQPGSGWYADFAATPVRFSLQVQLPAGWHCVSQGERGRVTDGEESWRVSTPQQGIYLLAGPFVRYQQDTPWGRGEVYLRTADPGMAQRYLDATAHYLDFYSRLIGPYPYPKFALVENLRQTGFGMPSFTLLGSRVIRLPFILHTSYPHEILHNWWGNGVWVDYDRGNWAEALTTYLSDYLLAEQHGRGAAQRRAALQKYADFVKAHNEIPLRAFRARHGEASQAIGYSKGMMFFHMLRRELGDAPFLNALRAFYRQFRFRTASFDDLQAVFARTTGRSLETEFRQWLQRTGAPQLSLGAVDVARSPRGYRVRLTIHQRQPGPAYRLRLPLAVQLQGADTARLQSLHMTERDQTFTLDFAAAPLQLAVDPAFDVFRRLDWRELPPSLGRVMGADRVVFVVPEAAPAAMRAAYLRLAHSWARPQDRIVGDGQSVALASGDGVWVLGKNNRWRSRVRAAAHALPVQVDGARVRVDDRWFSLTEHSVVLVLSGAEPKTSIAWLSAPSPDAVAALVRKVPHYSRYGYLAFAEPGSDNVLKGEWPVTDSPLHRRLTAAATEPLRLPERPPLAAMPAPEAVPAATGGH